VKIREIAILSALWPIALACAAHPLDLHATSINPSNEPGVLGIVRERVEKIAVDDQRLYWVGTHLPNTGDRNGWFLRSCQKRNCPATLVTYDAQLYGADNVFSVSGEQIYWYREDSRELLTCLVTGCNGAPRSLATALTFSAAAFDGERLYFSDRRSICSLPLLEPGPRQPIAASPGALLRVAVRDTFAYWVSVSGGHAIDGNNESSLVRARKDGSSSAIEIISNDVKDSFNHDFSITTDETSIYWTNNLPAGSIHRCPLAGCTGISDVVLAPLRAPQALHIDGSVLYYQYETKPYEYAVSSCALPECASSQLLIEHLDAPGALAMDDQYLYVATTEQDIGASKIEVGIRRLPKPDRELP